MSIHLEVLVKLPDGQYNKYCPIVMRQGWEDKVDLAKFDTKRDALNWAEFCLPEKLRVCYEG